MLIGSGRKRPDLATVRRIKRALREALQLPNDAMVTVTELACLEEGCAPVETVVGLLRSDTPQLQCKLHKATTAINADDLSQVALAWGFEVERPAFASFDQENS